jgi:hypothetical protein
MRNFSACPLCGHFLASLLAALGDESLERAVEEDKSAWIEFPWHASFAAMLTTYYDWHFEVDAETRSSRCPSCLRRINYLSQSTGMPGDEQAAVLQLERRPGLRT